LSKAGKKLDIIIANAGLMGTPFGKTQDGFEIQFGTNHLGHFVLINHLVPMLKPGARVVSLTSSGHRFSDVDLDDPNFERTPYNDFVSYGRSKTANVLFAVEFDRRHRANGIRATAVHPGSIPTELSRHLSAEVIASYAIPSDPAEAFAQGYKSIPQGAATSVWAAVVAPADTVGGRYCEDCHVAEIDPDPKAQRGVAAYAVDPDRAQALWTASERLVGERY
jgi:NAD(P)-dependent dehydrogenase (short-subunit alcohol dehydrogenase family)